MKAELKFGSKNLKGKNPQNLYIRIKHSNLDWDKSLKIKIDAKDWDFKKRQIITKHTLNNPIHSEHLQEVSRRVRDIYYSLKNTSESYHYTNQLDIKEWVKEKNRKAFIDVCERWYREYLEPKKETTEPYISDLYKESITQKFTNKAIGKDRHQRLTNIYRNILAFESFYNRKVRTDELDTNLWINEIIPFFRDEYEHGIHSEAITKKGVKKTFSGIGLSDAVIKMIKSAFQQTAKKYGRKGITFHEDILSDTNFSIKVAAKAKTFLNHQQVQSILNYENDKGNDGRQSDRIPNLDNKLWFLNVLYYGCFRINEVYRTLEGKTPQEVWDNDIDKTLLNKDGKRVYHWKCCNSKQKEIHTKNIPMFDKLGELLFGGFENAEQGNFPISFPKLSDKNTYRKGLQQITKNLKIEGRIIAHTMRRSFLNNLRKQNVSHPDLMQYSGHQTEAALLNYLDIKNRNVPTDVNLNQ
ncbi:MAG: hypothetical protein QNK70_05270 [Crocinitomicaceae bacterium]|tara:strand:- start:2175 stop:3578 length:1404 start_codon:yes stop_codon:yes gene_type:complete